MKTALFIFAALCALQSADFVKADQFNLSAYLSGSGNTNFAMSSIDPSICYMKDLFQGWIYAINVSAKDTKWALGTSYSATRVIETKEALLIRDGGMFAYHPISGILLWEFDGAIIDSKFSVGLAYSNTTGDLMKVAFIKYSRNSSDHLGALSVLTGNLIWAIKLPFSASIYQYLSNDRNPGVALIYDLSKGTQILYFDGHGQFSGNATFLRNLGAYPDSTITPDSQLVVKTNYSLQAYDAKKNLAPLWTLAPPDKAFGLFNLNYHNPATSQDENQVFVSIHNYDSSNLNTSYAVVSLDAESGKVLWLNKKVDNFKQQLSTIQSFFVGMDGNIYWVFTSKSNSDHSVIISLNHKDGNFLSEPITVLGRDVRGVTNASLAIAFAPGVNEHKQYYTTISTVLIA